MRQLSSCVNEKYKGFHVISIEYKKKLRKNIKPIDIIWRPKNLITFEVNYKLKGHVPTTMYFDFETTAPIDNCFDPEQQQNCLLCHML